MSSLLKRAMFMIKNINKAVTVPVVESKLNQDLLPAHDSGEDRVAVIGPRTISNNISDVGKALWHSRIVRHMLFASGIALAVALLATPPGWFTLGIGAFAAIAGVLTFCATSITQLLIEMYWRPEVFSFEFNALLNIRKGNFNAILPDQLFLGAMPNRVGLPFAMSNWERLHKLKIGAVLSVNEDWERKLRGPSIPYTERDYLREKIAYLPITSKDHVPLDIPKLEESADFIQNNLKAGKKVYVHCRAGRGRSAMAIAAYLIKYRNFTAEQSMNFIKARRPESSIRKKANALHEYAAFLRSHS